MKRGTRVVFECGDCGQMSPFPGAWPDDIEKGDLVAAHPEFVPACEHLIDPDNFAMHRDPPEAMRRAAAESTGTGP
jgi:hypothetical protein